jgi:Holliday junction resolvasome RuvABC DNA-binding subunit
MSVNLEEEINNAQADIQNATNALLKLGFTEEQMEQLARSVHARIALIQYGILKADKDIKRESAFQPGQFQTKVL